MFLDFIAISGDVCGMGYPGGKGRSYQRIISLMPPHRVYIETHLGGGAVMRRKRPAEASYGIDPDPAVITSWDASWPAATTILRDDAVSFLRRYTFQGDELVYSDPPYLPSTRRRRRVYRFDYDEPAHVELLSVLRALPCAVMLSGYPSCLYDRWLRGWHRVEFATPTHSGLRSEVLWMNFEPPALLHDHAHLGADFREREQIRRKRARLLQKIYALGDRERHALLAKVAEREGAVLRRILGGAS